MQRCHHRVPTAVFSSNVVAESSQCVVSEAERIATGASNRAAAALRREAQSEQHTVRPNRLRTLRQRPQAKRIAQPAAS